MILFVSLFEWTPPVLEAVILYVSLFEWTPSWRQEIRHPIIWNFASHLGLGLMVTSLFQVNPGNRKNIPTTKISSILTSLDSFNQISPKRRTKQVRIWSHSYNHTSPGTNLLHKRILHLILGLIQSSQWYQ